MGVGRRGKVASGWDSGGEEVSGGSCVVEESVFREAFMVFVSISLI